MEDLDSLLEDLGRGKPSSSHNPKKPARPVSSRVDLNELEDLMQDLAQPTIKPVPQAVPVQAVKVEAVKIVTPASVSTPVASSPQPIPSATPASPGTSPRNGSSNGNKENNVDDLEALMESLNVTSNRSARRSTAKLTPQGTPTKGITTPASPVVASPSKGSSSPVAPSSPSVTHASATTVDSSSVYSPPPVVSQTYKPYTPPVTPIQANNLPPSNPSPVYSPPIVLSPSNGSQAYTPPAQTYTPPATQPYNSKPAGPGAVKGDDLDQLLNNLTSQINTVDFENPASRGTCATCRGPILGEIVQALGRTFHPEHFICVNCKDPLGNKNFFEQNGGAHCQKCFELLFCPRCAHCDQSILDRCITALGKKWHPEHFICAQCLQPFPGGNFFEKNGRPYCENDFFALFAPKCAGCNEPIKGDSINALGQQWHPEHFVCTYCGKAFTGTFFEHGGKPYCEAHYHQQTGALCAGCGKPVMGRCVNALDKKWHPEHFVCAFCMNPLAGGSFSEKNGKAYCKDCHGKLFAAS